MDSFTTQSGPIGRIVQGIADLPGGTSVSLTFRRFPRFLPAEPGTGYDEQTVRFDIHGVPEELPVPPDVDEVVVLLQGLMDEQCSKADLLASLHRIFCELGIEDDWVATAAIQQETSSAPAGYQVMIARDMQVNGPDFEA
jgi:hypothetical protein